MFLAFAACLQNNTHTCLWIPLIVVNPKHLVLYPTKQFQWQPLPGNPVQLIRNKTTGSMVEISTDIDKWGSLFGFDMADYHSLSVTPPSNHCCMPSRWRAPSSPPHDYPTLFLFLEPRICRSRGGRQLQTPCHSRFSTLHSTSTQHHIFQELHISNKDCLSKLGTLEFQHMLRFGMRGCITLKQICRVEPASFWVHGLPPCS